MEKEELDEMLIIDQNDIFAYFAIIAQLKPKSVLDVGMYLKRMGAVCRQVCDCEVPRNIKLDALDIWPYNFPVYDSVYDRIFTVDCVPEEHYDLVIALYLPQIMQDDTIFTYLMQCGNIIFVEDSPVARNFFGSRMKVQAVSIGQDKHFLLASH